MAFRLKIADALLRSLANELPYEAALRERARARLAAALGVRSSHVDEQTLCDAVPDLDTEGRAKLRRALAANHAELLSLRNPRFDLSSKLP